MREETKKRARNTRITLLLLIISLLLSLTAFLVCEFAVGNDKLGFSPIFMLFIVFFMTLGLEYIGYAIVKKTMFIFSVGGLSLVVGAFILLLCLHVKWYVVLISAIVMCIVVFFSVFLFKAPETTLEFDNGEGSERKPYEQRKAEAAEQKAAELENEKQGLPQIKSFKD